MAKNKENLLCIGLMSGTSCDGIDAALIETDGKEFIKAGIGLTFDYPQVFRNQLKKLMQGEYGHFLQLEKQLTEFHCEAVQALLKKSALKSSEIDLLGFHGQTVVHNPTEGITWQIGNIQGLAHSTGINTIGDFRSRDVSSGGQGAPLVPIYLKYLTEKMPKPLMLVNIGGVANICYLGETSVLAFDTGPGNALIDDHMHKHFKLPFDRDGDTARSGSIDTNLLQDLLEDDYFSQKPPKSLDRNHFASQKLDSIPPKNAVATATEFTAIAIARSLQHCKSHPKMVIVSGGGRKNTFLMERLQVHFGAIPVQKCDVHNIDGDLLEAHAFGYLAVRSYRNLPISFPETTRTRQPLSGGVFCRVSAS
jgi:anhydro-N-acetylmuramic acid kinase